MKTCTKCHRELKEDAFSLLHPAKDPIKLRPDCKECVRDRSRIAYAKDPEAQAIRMSSVRTKAVQVAQTIVAQYLVDHFCVDCGESDPIVLDFDHVCGTKVCDVSRMVWAGYRAWRIEKEIAKCEVRCANCHRRITHRRKNLT